MTTAIQSIPAASAALELPPEKLDLLIRTVARGCTPDEFQLFVHVCRTRKVDPFSKLIYPVKRWDSKQKAEVMQIQSSIDYFRLQAERTGKYAGQIGPQWCGQDGQWKDVWLEQRAPAAARVGVLRTDFKEPLWTVALWANYVQTTKEGLPTRFWANMGPLMIAKCAEALSLRRAFPEDLAGLYTADEMAQSVEAPREVEVEAAQAPREAAALPAAARSQKTLDALVDKLAKPQPAQPPPPPPASVDKQTGEILGDPEIGRHKWQASPGSKFDVDIPVSCGMWNTWADQKLPEKSALAAKGCKSWREASRGSLGGYRSTMLQEAVSWAQDNPSERSEFHERCAATLSVMRHLLAHPPAPSTKTEPGPEDMQKGRKKRSDSESLYPA